MAKREVTVILDSRNRELKYVQEPYQVAEAIRQLKKNGKKPWRTIVKVRR